MLETLLSSPEGWLVAAAGVALAAVVLFLNYWVVRTQSRTMGH